MTKNKKLVIISGVTGAIGSAVLAEYAQEKDTVIYGISRKALSFETFLESGKLPKKSFICSIGEHSNYKNLFQNIDYSHISEIIYIHALGLYPFEVNKQGALIVQNDKDGDGINDDVIKLTFDSFVNATTNLFENWKGKTSCVIFAGIADKYKPAAHQSWWKTMEKVKEYMNTKVAELDTVSMIVLNISSVLCPNEMITRPFVFTSTDSDQQYWLAPHEVSHFLKVSISEHKSGFYELEKYHLKPDFSPVEYYNDTSFTPRKVNELFK